LRFANPSPSSGWIEEFHLQAVVHTRHTANGSRECAPDDRLREAIRFSACGAMDCFRLRSLSYGGQVVATLLAMMGWTAPDGINVPDW
jgi:hypothetical protein